MASRFVAFADLRLPHSRIPRKALPILPESKATSETLFTLGSTAASAVVRRASRRTPMRLHVRISVKHRRTRPTTRASLAAPGAGALPISTGRQRFADCRLVSAIGILSRFINGKTISEQLSNKIPASPMPRCFHARKLALIDSKGVSFTRPCGNFTHPPPKCSVSVLAGDVTAGIVAQTCSLPYRGFEIRSRCDGSTICRRQVGDTPD